MLKLLPPLKSTSSVSSHDRMAVASAHRSCWLAGSAHPTGGELRHNLRGGGGGRGEERAEGPDLGELEGWQRRGEDRVGLLPWVHEVVLLPGQALDLLAGAQTFEARLERLVLRPEHGEALLGLAGG